MSTSTLHPQAKEKIDKLLNKINEVRSKVKSVIVFGSAVRGDSFKPDVSDVDVAIVIEKSNDLKISEIKDVDEQLEIGIFTVGQFLDLWLSGDPLAHMIWREGIAVVDDGFYSKLKARGEPKITKLTIMKLRFWGLRDLAHAIKPGMSRSKAIRSLHHAVRNFARLRIARDKRVFAITDEEILRHLDHPLSKRYEEFLFRLEYNKEYFEQLILEAMDVIEKLSGEPLPRLDELMNMKL